MIETLINQFPALLEGFYIWHRNKHCFFGIVLFLLFFIGVYFLRKSRKMENEFDEVVFFVSLFVVMFSFILYFINLYYLALIVKAPELYLIDYFIN
jgi:glucose uptake protein GlcU